MWTKERNLWEEEDQRIQAKIKEINRETQNYLKQQVEQKKGKNKKMDSREVQMNKAIMREIKAKKAEMKEMEQAMQKPQSDADSINDRE